MSQFVNLSDLKAAAKDWLSEVDLDDTTLSRAVALTEADIRRRLRVFQMEITADFTIDGETETVPSRFLSTRSLYIPGYRPMTYLTPEQFGERQACISSDRPLFFTLEGVEDALPVYRFYPTPDATYTARLTYIADPALIDDEDCNAILEEWPDVYLYGTLAHLGGYLGNEARLPTWERIYSQVLKGIGDADLRDKIDGSTLLPSHHYRLP